MAVPEDRGARQSLLGSEAGPGKAICAASCPEYLCKWNLERLGNEQDHPNTSDISLVGTLRHGGGEESCGEESRKGR